MFNKNTIEHPVHQMEIDTAGRLSLRKPSAERHPSFGEPKKSGTLIGYRLVGAEKK